MAPKHKNQIDIFKGVLISESFYFSSSLKKNQITTLSILDSAQGSDLAPFLEILTKLKTFLRLK